MAGTTAAGLLGYAELVAGAAPQVVWTCPSDSQAAITLTVCNTSSQLYAKTRAGYVTGGNPAPIAGQNLLGGRVLEPSETIEIQKMLGAGQGLAAWVDTAGVNVTINGRVEPL